MIYHESDYESTFMAMLEAQKWQPLNGIDMPRPNQTEAIYADDAEKFLTQNYPGFTHNDIRNIIDTLRLTDGETKFSAMHKIHTLLTDGINFRPETSNESVTVNMIDFDHPDENIFRAVQQLSIQYRDNGQISTRRPDILLYVNGIPLCIIELKNPTDERTTIHDAWEQIYIRYWRDIPSLLKYCPLACISDGAKTRLGTVRTPYEHFYAWRKVNEDDEISRTAYDETLNMIQGALSPARLIEIYRDYLCFKDEIHDREESVIVCRYPQYFASKLMARSIAESVIHGGGKGGTYFGATGCGKTYAMMFLARQLALRTKGIGSPTIVMIVDREDLQSQGAKLFTKCQDFLCLGAAEVVKSRNHLKAELSSRDSGGFYICTVQKFCDGIGELNTRKNIICFSDEAHRTQLERAKAIRFSEERKSAYLSKSYAQTLHEAFPNATFVGFTGTPVQATYDTFGKEIDRYTMDIAVADGITVPIKYHPRITRITLDREKADEIEEYYRICANEGATPQDIAASKQAMSSMEVLLSEPSRLERLADDIHAHYTASLANEPTRVQKAMNTCSSRKIAYSLLKIFERKYPEWFTAKKCREGINPTPEILRTLDDMPFIAMIASNSPDDDADMYEYLGGLKNDSRNEKFAAMFKNDSSNFSVVIVVDMWITGFDVPSLTYMYNDKPLEKHILIQTISRVNRRYPGKDYGLIIDYVGIRDNMREAVKLYGGEANIADSPDDAEKAKRFFTEELIILRNMFTGYDLSPFLDSDIDPVKRYALLSKAAEYVFASPEKFRINTNGGKGVKSVFFREYFTAHVKILRAAYDICQPSGILDEADSSLA